MPQACNSAPPVTGWDVLLAVVLSALVAFIVWCYTRD